MNEYNAYLRADTFTTACSLILTQSNRTTCSYLLSCSVVLFRVFAATGTCKPSLAQKSACGLRAASAAAFATVFAKGSQNVAQCIPLVGVGLWHYVCAGVCSPCALHKDTGILACAWLVWLHCTITGVSEK